MKLTVYSFAPDTRSRVDVHTPSVVGRHLSNAEPFNATRFGRAQTLPKYWPSTAVYWTTSSCGSHTFTRASNQYASSCCCLVGTPVDCRASLKGEPRAQQTGVSICPPTDCCSTSGSKLGGQTDAGMGSGGQMEARPLFPSIPGAWPGEISLES